MNLIGSFSLELKFPIHGSVGLVMRAAFFPRVWVAAQNHKNSYNYKNQESNYTEVSSNKFVLFGQLMQNIAVVFQA